MVAETTGPAAAWRRQLAAGERIVCYEMCVSCLWVTWQRLSPPVLVRSRRERFLRGLGYSLLSLLCGPWGIPWGITGTLRAWTVNIHGGHDLTEAMQANTQWQIAK